MPDPKLNCNSGRVTPIKIMNLPFKANVNEILDFFHGYRIIPDSVSQYSIMSKDYLQGSHCYDKLQ